MYKRQGEDDLEAQRKRMEEEEAACQQFAEQLAEGERQIENLQHSISRNEVDLRQKEHQMSCLLYTSQRVLCGQVYLAGGQDRKK